MRRLLRSSAFYVLLSLGSPVGVAVAVAQERPLLSPLFGDMMVLQRGKPVTFWGWAQAGEEVRVTLAGQTATGRAGVEGRWQLSLTPPPAGGPYEVTVASAATTVQLRDVLVGDVWLCGGQSNMNWGLAQSAGGAAEVAAANHPRLRFFRVQQQAAYTPAAVPSGRWQVCTPDTVGPLTAVGYYFARRVQAEIEVPIGLIQCAVGGTPAETWMSPAALAAFPEFHPALAEIGRLRERGGPVYGNYIMHWYDDHDIGLRGQPWSEETLDDSRWSSVPVPGGFAALGVGETPAVVWFRRDVLLPDPLPAGAARLHLGVVEKMDTSFLNGRWIGASSWVENPRNYAIPAGVLRPGRNQVTVRVLKTRPDGGFPADPAALQLELGDGTRVPLAGEWRAKVSVDARPPHPLPLGYENYPTMPTVLFSGMIEPLAPFALTGALWYQGEANASRAHQYRTLLPAMIADWRRAFGQGDFPFYLVSLPAFGAPRAVPGDDAWAELREAQAHVARSVPHTGLAITIDTGDPADIHPREKQPVGERLARLALARHYGRSIVDRGPELAAVVAEPGALRLRFVHAEGGLVVRGDESPEFAVAGADRRWVWAQACVEGDTVTVSAPEVPAPVAVRYAWQGSPRATLFNAAGLPAAPFRTDDWPGVTPGGE